MVRGVHKALGALALLGLAMMPALAAPQRAEAEQITVFAAASLKTALDEVVRGYDGEVVVSYAGTPVLARQIVQGAPADLFLAASPDWMDHVEEAGRVAPGTRHDLLGNRLVLVAHGAGEDNPRELTAGDDIAGMLGESRLAMALVEAVPAGVYGKAALESLGLWAGLESRVVQSDNVRTTLKLVALGEAPLGIVYATDARAEPGVHVAGTFPEASHPPIRYPVAAMAGRGAALALLDYLRGDAAARIFGRHGFSVPGG